MNQQVQNSIVNVPVSLTTEQFVQVGNTLPVYGMVSSKVRSVAALQSTVLDLMNVKDNDMGRNFLISIDSTGSQHFASGDSTNLTSSEAAGFLYALYDLTNNFAGYYRLDSTGLGPITYVAGGNNASYGSTYTAMAISNTNTAMIKSALKAQALLSSVMAPGFGNIITITELDDTVNHYGYFQVPQNLYTASLSQFKVCQIPVTQYQRFNFPFYTAFNGTWYNVGQTVQVSLALNAAAQYVLIFFKDIYGNVSFPFVYLLDTN